MRTQDIKKAGKYIERIVKDPFSKQSRSAFKRYICEGFVLMYERFKGLDFTMVYQCEENEHNNNYSKSPQKILEKIFREIDFSKPHSFLDLGCGKGYVMVNAAKYPFIHVGGVEYTPELCDICKNNLEVLKLEQKIQVFNCDAKEFRYYADYDVFYFCNPFDETILSVVAKKIYESHRYNECTLYYLNPHQEERQKAILDAGFKLVKLMPDDSESYFDIKVYRKEK